MFETHSTAVHEQSCAFESSQPGVAFQGPSLSITEHHLCCNPSFSSFRSPSSIFPPQRWVFFPSELLSHSFTVSLLSLLWIYCLS